MVLLCRKPICGIARGRLDAGFGGVILPAAIAGFGSQHVTGYDRNAGFLGLG
jgi:hypothetical protein